MTRPTREYYLRIVQLYERMPAKKVAKKVGCSVALVWQARFRINRSQELVRICKVQK